MANPAMISARTASVLCRIGGGGVGMLEPAFAAAIRLAVSIGSSSVYQMPTSTAENAVPTIAGDLKRDQNFAPSVLRHARIGQATMMSTYRMPTGRAMLSYAAAPNFRPPSGIQPGKAEVSVR